MESIPDGWTERHVEAYEAWRAGDTERLCEACKPEINGYAHRWAKAYNLRWAVEELRDAGRKGVEKARQRWDPRRGVPFQGYAWQDIFREIQHAAAGLQQKAAEEVERERGVEASGRGNLEVLAATLQTQTNEQWRDIIAGFDIESLDALRNWLDANRDTLIASAGKNKFGSVRGATAAYWTIRTMGEHGFRDISGPINAQIIRGLHRSYNLPSESVSFSQLGKLLGVSDKTAKKYYECWEKDPPRENEDLFDYLYRIVDPRGYRRLRRRLNQESE